jgi:hypothetical protein
VQVNLYVQNVDGKLDPLKTDCDLPTIPRIGEAVSIGDRRTRARVKDVEYLLPHDSTEILVAIILEHEPSGP